MGDARRIVRDAKRSESEMTGASANTAYSMLEVLTRAEHRGPTDTWTAARDRTARKIGIKPAYARRIWQCWRDMKDVSGNALLKLQAAYEAECARMDAIADHYDRRTKELLHEADLESGARRVEGGRVLDRQSASSASAPVPGAPDR